MPSVSAPRPMRSAIEADISITDGTIYLGDKRSFVAALAKLPPGHYVLKIDAAGQVRELAANNRYFAVLRDIATYRNENEADATHTTQTLHTEYKDRFNGGQSTAQLPPEQFETYLLRVKAHAAQEYGVEFQRDEPMFVSR